MQKTDYLILQNSMTFLPDNAHPHHMLGGIQRERYCILLDVKQRLSITSCPYSVTLSHKGQSPNEHLSFHAHTVSLNRIYSPLASLSPRQLAAASSSRGSGSKDLSESLDWLYNWLEYAVRAVRLARHVDVVIWTSRLLRSCLHDLSAHRLEAQELSAAFPAAHHLPSYRPLHPPPDDDRKQGLPSAQATSLDDQPLAPR